MFRKRLKKRSSKRSFRKNSGSHKKNIVPTPMRGGWRI